MIQFRFLCVTLLWMTKMVGGCLAIIYRALPGPNLGSFMYALRLISHK